MNENYRSSRNIVALSNAFVSSVRGRMKSGEAVAVSDQDGIVRIIRHRSRHLEEAVVDNVLATYHSGKACVLTSKNEEALRVLGLLLKRGVRAKLVQSLDGFRLYNLSEIRYFLKVIKKQTKTAVISEKIWNDAIQKTEEAYSQSTCLENCRNLWNDFACAYPVKYYSDLEEFIRESNFEDFYDDDKETVFVSTIHKSKGREFDSVYILLDNYAIDTDEAKRCLYVGITRARRELYVHCNTPIFDGISVPGTEKTYDAAIYPEPREITIQLSYKDVVLDYFKEKRELIFKLRSGMRLGFDNFFLTGEIDGRTVRVAKLSKKSVSELGALFAKGYSVKDASVRFVVAWKGEDDDFETPVILADLHLLTKK